jgi:hypothetical protein
MRDGGDFLSFYLFNFTITCHFAPSLARNEMEGLFLFKFYYFNMYIISISSKCTIDIYMYYYH